MASILVLYHSQQYGNTEAMAKAVAAGAQGAGAEVTLHNANEERFDVSRYRACDAAAFGTPDYYSYIAGTLKVFLDDWFLAKQRDPKIGPVIHYGKTDHHPSRIGSYLIACVHFATVYGKSPVGLPATLYRSEGDRKRNRPHVTMDEKTARLLQESAWDAVQEMRKLQEHASTRPAAE